MNEVPAKALLSLDEHHGYDGGSHEGGDAVDGEGTFEAGETGEQTADQGEEHAGE